MSSLNDLYGVGSFEDGIVRGGGKLVTNALSDLTRKTAAESLGLSPDPSGESVRTTFLKHLRDTEFSPGALQYDAATALGVISHEGFPLDALDRRVEKQLESEVESFAEAYWRLPPAERRTRWQELHNLCDGYPRLADRMQALEAGLEVVLPEEYENPLQASLGRAIAELYPLKPALRAARRVSLLRDVGSPGELHRTARELRLSYSFLEKVDHGLLSSLMQDRSAVPLIRHSRVNDPERMAVSPSSSSDLARGVWVAILICIGICSGLFRAVNRSDSTSNSHSNIRSDIPRSSYSEPPQYKQSKEFEEALAGMFKERRLVKIESGTDPDEVPRLTRTRMNCVLRIRSRNSLSDDEANRLAQDCVLAETSVDSIQPHVDLAEWDRYVRFGTTAGQRQILTKLAKVGMTPPEFAELFQAYVKAARPGLKPAVPPGERRE